MITNSGIPACIKYLEFDDYAEEEGSKRVCKSLTENCVTCRFYCPDSTDETRVHYISLANQLGYSDKALYKLRHAANEYEMQNIMKNARMGNI